MLSLTVKSSYSVAALTDLAQHYGQSLVQIKDLTHRRRIPRNYLEQILNRLTKQGLIRSVRGNRGGYELSNSPESISLLTILESAEGELKLKASAGNGVLGDIFAEIQEDLRDKLSSTSLQDILQREMQQNQALMYHI